MHLITISWNWKRFWDLWSFGYITHHLFNDGKPTSSMCTIRSSAVSSTPPLSATSAPPLQIASALFLLPSHGSPTCLFFCPANPISQSGSSFPPLPLRGISSSREGPEVPGSSSSITFDTMMWRHLQTADHLERIISVQHRSKLHCFLLWITWLNVLDKMPKVHCGRNCVRITARLGHKLKCSCLWKVFLLIRPRGSHSLTGCSLLRFPWQNQEGGDLGARPATSEGI